MLRELLDIFRSDHPLQRATEHFNDMLSRVRQMTLDSSAVFWGRPASPEELTALYERDVQVNKLERRIRKLVISHLAGPVPSDVPYGLLLMSLVKDVERIGDYAKNLWELADVSDEPLPEDDVVGELREIARSVETFISEAAEVFANSDQERARELTLEGRSISKRCDQLVLKIAKSGHSSAMTVKLALAARFYKRIEGHLLNLMSGLIMPLHKLDYYDENFLRNRR